MSRLRAIGSPSAPSPIVAPLPWPRAQPRGASLASQTRQRVRDLNDSHLVFSRWIYEANRGPRLATQPENRPRRNHGAPVCLSIRRSVSAVRAERVRLEPEPHCRRVGWRHGSALQGRALRALHVPGRPLVLLNAWDAGSAAVIARAARPRSRRRAPGRRTPSATPTGSSSPASRCSRPWRRLRVPWTCP